MARKGKVEKFATEELEERPIRIKLYKYLFLILCEDQKTEPEYFGRFESQIPKDTIYLKPIGTGLDPQGVVDRAIIERDNLQFLTKREVDEVWAVFDKDDADENDTKIQNFESAFEKAKIESINIAYSNEVFELWLLLHFLDINKRIPLPRKKIYRLLQDNFRKIKGNEKYKYDHSKPDSRTIDFVFSDGNQTLAIERAEALLTYHNDRSPLEANPSTLVHLLIQSLMEWIRYFSQGPF